MESYMNPVVLIPILLFGVGAAIYYFRSKIEKLYPKKKKAGAIESEPTEIIEGTTFEPIYAMVLDNSDPIVKRWYWDTIPGSIVKHILEVNKTLGIQHDTEDNKKAHILIKTLEPGNLNPNMDKVYKPISIPILKDDSPVELNFDTEHPEYEIILSSLLTEEKNFLQKYGMVLWWAAIIGFIIFMMVSG